jgi:hypothetical protein
MVERLEEKLNKTLQELGKDPILSLEEKLEKEKMNLELGINETKDNSKPEKPINEDLIKFCQLYYEHTCNQPTFGKDNRYKCQDVLTTEFINSSNCNQNGSKKSDKLDDFYGELIESIENLKKNTYNIDIKNIEDIEDKYKRYQVLQTDINEHYQDNMLIDNRLNIINSKLNNSLNSIKLYSMLIVFLFCLNIAFYVIFVQNK